MPVRFPCRAHFLPNFYASVHAVFLAPLPLRGTVVREKRYDGGGLSDLLASIPGMVYLEKETYAKEMAFNLFPMLKCRNPILFVFKFNFSDVTLYTGEEEPPISLISLNQTIATSLFLHILFS